MHGPMNVKLVSEIFVCRLMRGNVPASVFGLLQGARVFFFDVCHVIRAAEFDCSSELCGSDCRWSFVEEPVLAVQYYTTLAL
jgi:hypothetical protein